MTAKLWTRAHHACRRYGTVTPLQLAKGARCKVSVARAYLHGAVSRKLMRCDSTGRYSLRNEMAFALTGKQP